MMAGKLLDSLRKRNITGDRHEKEKNDAAKDVTGSSSAVSEAENKDGQQNKLEKDQKTQDKHEKGWVCTICNINFTDAKAKVMECDRCKKHACAKCLKMSATQYSACFLGMPNMPARCKPIHGFGPGG